MVAKEVQAAGGVVYRSTPAGVQVVVVHRPHYEDWSLPKGKLDPDEDPIACALREVREETGLQCRAEGELPPIDYTDDKGRPKHVRYWLMVPDAANGEIGSEDSEVDVASWEPLARALERLTYPLDREVLRSAATRIGVDPNEAADPAPRLAAAPGMKHLASVDLGSNSFRLVIARVGGDLIEPIDRLREGVQLAASLDGSRRLTAAGQQRALEALSRFGQRIAELSSSKVRAVGTNTLRKAKNRDEFLELAEAALGHPIEIISGMEEARLIYTGVWHSVPPTDGRRLVVDIGGGSTEVIVGKGHVSGLAESLFMGCVSWSRRYFSDDKLSQDAFKKATLAARVELQRVAKSFRQSGWEEVYGASGTVKAIEAILVANGWSDDGISYSGMKRLRKELIGRSSSKLKIPSLSADRAQVLPGGLAILMGVFRALKIERMLSSPGALREGVLYDLVGRLHRRDVRDDTIALFVQRYGVDIEQAERVAATSEGLLAQVIERWELPLEHSQRFLVWAASLHEIGLAVSHGGYQRHGAYLVENSDLPGFSKRDQQLLGGLIRGHRRKLRNQYFDALPTGFRESALRLCLLLRLAVLLNRSRSSTPVPEVGLRVGDRSVSLTLPKKWLGEHPLTRVDLQQEVRCVAKAGYKLTFR